MHTTKKAVIFSHFIHWKEREKIFKSHKKTFKKNFSIGICGCERGCGVTHFTIALANYCASKLCRSTACLELNQTGAFRRLTQFSSASLSQIKGHSVISIYDVDYYPELFCTDIPEIYNIGYCYLLFDFGILTEETYNELLRCDHKIIIGSLVPWNADCYHNFFQKYIYRQKTREGFYYLVLFGGKKDMHDFSGKRHIYMRQLPFLKNPFCIEKEHFVFLQSFLS